jgi:hypothetical protein
MPRTISDRTTLHTLKKEAKRWLKALAGGVRDARLRFERAFHDAPPAPTLRDVQHALALEHGLPGWAALKARLAEAESMRPYDDVAHAVVEGYATGDDRAMRLVWEYFDHRRTWEFTRRYMRLDLGKTEFPQNADDDRLTLEASRAGTRWRRSSHRSGAAPWLWRSGRSRCSRLTRPRAGRPRCGRGTGTRSSRS